MMDTASGGAHDKMHWGCCWMPILGKILWVLAFLDLIGALVAYWQGGQFYGVSAETWLWFSLVKGMLSLGAKASKHHWCWHQVHKA